MRSRSHFQEEPEQKSATLTKKANSGPLTNLKWTLVLFGAVNPKPTTGHSSSPTRETKCSVAQGILGKYNQKQTCGSSTSRRNALWQWRLGDMGKRPGPPTLQPPSTTLLGSALGVKGPEGWFERRHTNQDHHCFVLQPLKSDALHFYLHFVKMEVVFGVLFSSIITIFP